MVLMAHNLVVSKESSAFADQFIIADFIPLSTFFSCKTRRFSGGFLVKVAKRYTIARRTDLYQVVTAKTLYTVM